VTRSLAIAVLATLVACGGRPTTTLANAPTPASSATLDDARNAERGISGARDYSRAASIYVSLCRDGKGSFEACIALIDALVDGRGVDRDIATLDRLFHELCKRGDSVSCVEEILDRAPVGGLGEDTKPQPPDRDPNGLDAQMANVRRACAKHDGRACELAVTDSLGEDPHPELDTIACEQGRDAACGRLLHRLESCENTDDVSACEIDQLEDWNRDDQLRHRAAILVIQRCDAGDAVACVHIPTKRVPLAERCTANDYFACAMLGCLGDAASESMAKKNHVETNCQDAHRLGGLEARNGTLPRTAHVGRPPDAM
jgi:hypothetical protein